MVQKIQQQYRYFNLKSVECDLKVEFESLKELVRFLDHYKLQNIYRVRKTETEVESFGVPSKGGFFFHPAQGFMCLEDFAAASQGQFPDAQTYYKALEMHISKHEDYLVALENGLVDKIELERLVLNGYKQGFPIFKEKMENGEWKWVNSNFKTPSELLAYAESLGFSKFEEMEIAFNLGFVSKMDYDLAMEHGFLNANDKVDGHSRKFYEGEQYYFAIKHNIRDAEDLSKYINLETIGEPDMKHDQKVLISILSKLPEAKKVSINKLLEVLNKHLAEYFYEDTTALPPWFTQEFKDDKEAIIKFLNQDIAKKYGIYDEDGEFFEVSQLHKRKVVIDGSNVAHSSGTKRKKDPELANIILVVKALAAKGIEEITVIADASLKHKVIDMDNLAELKELCTYLEAPAEKSADKFMIEIVKKEHCLVLTNDTFREWKVSNTWVALHIDYYRISFMIEGKNVLLPDFDKVDLK